MARKTTKKLAEPVYAAPALEKGLSILELLARRKEPLSRAEIAKALKRSANELYRMLSVLERCRYVRRDEGSGKYGLTLKLYELGQSARLVEVLKAAATGPMRAFAREAEAECHLSVIEEGRLVVIHQETGGGAIRLTIEAGTAHSPLHTLSGRVILAQMEAEERDYQLGQARQAFPELHRKRKLNPNWARLSKEAVQWAKDETLVGLQDAAVAVGAESGVVAALASSVFHTGLTPAREERLGKRLLGTAAAVRTALGAVS